MYVSLQEIADFMHTFRKVEPECPPNAAGTTIDDSLKASGSSTGHAIDGDAARLNLPII